MNDDDPITSLETEHRRFLVTELFHPYCVYELLLSPNIHLSILYMLNVYMKHISVSSISMVKPH